MNLKKEINEQLDLNLSFENNKYYTKQSKNFD